MSDRANPGLHQARHHARGHAALRLGADARSAILIEERESGVLKRLLAARAAERLEALGRLTFNAWAVDGYQAIFWYEAGVAQLGPQVAVLLGFCLVFLAAARGLAHRWQVV